MKKLGICGDSFMSSILFDANNKDNGYGKHFTELLSEKLGWDIVTYARAASSNQLIRLQIDEIIKESPDLVLIGTTSPDRYELPVNDLSTNDYHDKSSTLRDKMYNPLMGLYCVEYSGYKNQSSLHSGFQNTEVKMISDSLNNIFDGNHMFQKSKLNNYDINILKNWFERYYDFNWKIQQDSWIIENGLRKLMDNNINFLCTGNNLPLDRTFLSNCSIIYYKEELNPWCYYYNSEENKKTKYAFHTTLEDQQLLANNWFDYLSKIGIL